MHIITGGTGHVGSAVAEALISKGEQITIVSRSSQDAKAWIDKGATVAVADVYDVAAIHEIFKTGDTVFLLNPPADPRTDTDKQELKTATALAEALKYSEVKKVVVASTLGAQPGERLGDLNTLHHLEQLVSKLSYPYNIIRSAYYMSNWDAALKTIPENGQLISFYPADFKFPMVAPKDIGELAAKLLIDDNSQKIYSIQGPELYSASDVAAAFAKALKKEVQVKVVPKEQWIDTYKSLGFSDEAAESYFRMTEISLEGGFEMPDHFHKGSTTLQQYVDGLVNSN